MNQMGELRNVLTLMGKKINEIQTQQNETQQKLLTIQDNLNIYKEIQYNQNCNNIWENDVKKINTLFYPYQSDFSKITNIVDDNLDNLHFDLLFNETDVE